MVNSVKRYKPVIPMEYVLVICRSSIGLFASNILHIFQTIETVKEEVHKYKSLFWASKVFAIRRKVAPSDTPTTKSESTNVCLSKKCIFVTTMEFYKKMHTP